MGPAPSVELLSLSNLPWWSNPIATSPNEPGINASTAVSSELLCLSMWISTIPPGGSARSPGVSVKFCCLPQSRKWISNLRSWVKRISNVPLCPEILPELQRSSSISIYHRITTVPFGPSSINWKTIPPRVYSHNSMPLPQYCVQFWSPYYRKDIIKLERVQTKNTRMQSGLDGLSLKEKLDRLGLNLVLLKLLLCLPQYSGAIQHGQPTYPHIFGH